jgi:hypothetical protein
VLVFQTIGVEAVRMDSRVIRSRLTCIVSLLMTFVVSGRVNAQDCYESSVVNPSPFMGNDGEIFKLSDGSVWEVKYEYEYLYEYYPSVIICPNRGKLILGKKSLSVGPVSAAQRRPGSPKAAPNQSGTWEVVEETNLEGSIQGTVQQGRIFKTTSGHIYEVTGLTLQLVVELQPEVIVLRSGEVYKLVVKGFDEPLICRKLNTPSSSPRTVTQTGGWTVFEETAIQGSVSGSVR